MRVKFTHWFYKKKKKLKKKKFYIPNKFVETSGRGPGERETAVPLARERDVTSVLHCISSQTEAL